jgi:hypothetical protein
MQCVSPYDVVSIYPLRMSPVLKPRVKRNCPMHLNYPDVKAIYTVHFSSLACLEYIFDVNYYNEKNMGVIEVNLELFEFFGTQTIEGSRKFQSLPLFGWRKRLIFFNLSR